MHGTLLPSHLTVFTTMYTCTIRFTVLMGLVVHEDSCIK